MNPISWLEVNRWWIFIPPFLHSFFNEYASSLYIMHIPYRPWVFILLCVSFSIFWVWVYLLYHPNQSRLHLVKIIKGMAREPVAMVIAKQGRWGCWGCDAPPPYYFRRRWYHVSQTLNVTQRCSILLKCVFFKARWLTGLHGTVQFIHYILKICIKFMLEVKCRF